MCKPCVENGFIRDRTANAANDVKICNSNSRNRCNDGANGTEGEQGKNITQGSDRNKVHDADEGGKRVTIWNKVELRKLSRGTVHHSDGTWRSIFGQNLIGKYMRLKTRCRVLV